MSSLCILGEGEGRLEGEDVGARSRENCLHSVPARTRKEKEKEKEKDQ